MKGILHKYLFITFGLVFVLIGIMGIFVPVLPTTPFLILALVLFSNSSPKFHHMLLHSRWFGSALRQWEETKTVTQTVKNRAYIVVVISFSISIAILQGWLKLQLMLVGLMAICLFYIRRLDVNE